jgi:carbonic anhydrase
LKTDIKKFLLRNQKWVENKLDVDPEYFDRLARGQSPDVLYIGCSDSRVTAEEMMGAEPGEIFVHRNVANQVIPTDSNLNAVVQYAVEQLKVEHIVICGHFGCGGILAALNPRDMGQINHWLQGLRDVYRLHAKELNAIHDEQKKFDRLVELNVLEQAINIMKIDHVQKAWTGQGYPKIHCWVLNIRSGLIVDLKFNMEKEFAKLKDIYGLE